LVLVSPGGLGFYWLINTVRQGTDKGMWAAVAVAGVEKGCYAWYKTVVMNGRGGVRVLWW